MASFFLAPAPVNNTTFFLPGGNTPGNGVKVFQYVAGSVSTKQTTFADNAGNSAYANPLILDSGGNIPNGGVMWFTSGQQYKFVWAPSTDTDPPTSPLR